MQEQQVLHSSRRKFIKLGVSALAVTATVMTTPSALAALARQDQTRVLSFYNLATDEKLCLAYWRQGQYDPTAFKKIARLMRDHYVDRAHPIDPALLDALYDVQTQLGIQGPIEVVSGYRSALTNMRMASLSDGVAKQSLHTKGMAIDLRMPGASLPAIYETARALKRGGVGYYPDAQFVHMDVGGLRAAA